MTEFRELVMSKLLAQANGHSVKFWPPPCETCGVEWKLTPAGRWFIEHTFPHRPPGVFATQPIVARAERPQDPLEDPPMLVGQILRKAMEEPDDAA